MNAALTKYPLLALAGLLASGPALQAATGLDPVGYLQAVAPAPAAGFSFVRLDHGVQLRVAGVAKNVLFYGPGIVRVNANLGASHWQHPSLAVVAQPATVAFTVLESAETLTVATERLRIVADKKTGALASQPRTLDNTLATYLPAGADWYDFRTSERFAGGRTVTKHCPLDTFPVYVRAGSIVPMGPADLQYATARPDAPYEIRIYPGADATFAIYEDDNETYAYERGERATYELKWDDAKRTLRIGARQGSFPGMVATRELKLVLVATDAALARTIHYTGTPCEVCLKP